MSKAPKKTKAEKIAPPVMDELTAATAGSTANLESLMEPSDPLLKQKGGDTKIYKAIRSDDQVKTVLEQRQSAMVAAEWEVDAGGTDAASVKAADDLRTQLKAMKFDRASKGMWESIYYGYRLGECIWNTDGKSIILERVKVRDQTRFRFDLAGRPRFITGGGKDAPLPEQKFWITQTGADHDDDPYGLGLAHWLYWPVFFKRQGLSFWLQFLDKIGTPSVWGQHPPQATDIERNKLLAALNSLRRNSTVITPVGVDIKLLEAARSATPDFAALIRVMNEAISKIVVGQTMTVENGSSRSQAEVHMDVRGDIVKADADLLCESFNQGPVVWLTYWNHPTATPPRVFRRTEAPEDLGRLAERDAKLVQVGYRPSLARVQEVYGDGYLPIEASAPPKPDDASNPGDAADGLDAGGDGKKPKPQTLPEFADAGGMQLRPTDAVDDITAQLSRQAEPAIAAIAAKAEQLLHECGSLQEFSDRLVELYPAAPDAVIGEAIAQALALGDLQGRATVTDDPGADDPAQPGGGAA